MDKFDVYSQPKGPRKLCSFIYIVCTMVAVLPSMNSFRTAPKSPVATATVKAHKTGIEKLLAYG